MACQMMGRRMSFVICPPGSLRSLAYIPVLPRTVWSWPVPQIRSGRSIPSLPPPHACLPLRLVFPRRMSWHQMFLDQLKFKLTVQWWRVAAQVKPHLRAQGFSSVSWLWTEWQTVSFCFCFCFYTAGMLSLVIKFCFLTLIVCNKKVRKGVFEDGFNMCCSVTDTTELWLR